MKESYNDLIVEIFGESQECINEWDFVQLLPAILKNNRPIWNGDKMAKLIVLRYGLLSHKKHTLKEIGIEFGGLHKETIRANQRIAIRYLRHHSRIRLYAPKHPNFGTNK